MTTTTPTPEFGESIRLIQGGVQAVFHELPLLPLFCFVHFAGHAAQLETPHSHAFQKRPHLGFAADDAGHFLDAMPGFGDGRGLGRLRHRHRNPGQHRLAVQTLRGDRIATDVR